MKSPTTSTPFPSTLHPERERDGRRATVGRHTPAGDRREPVPDEDRAAVRRGEHQAPREAVLEVACDAELRVHAPNAADWRSTKMNWNAV